MVKFTLDNDQEGIRYCTHITTGYEAAASHRDNFDLSEPAILIFIRHVVGENGHPYIEVGYRGLTDREIPEHLSQLKAQFSVLGFKEVVDLDSAPAHQNMAVIHSHHEGSATLRLDSTQNQISAILPALKSLIYNEAYEFIEEQESIKNCLFLSMMHFLGGDFVQTRGKKYAEQKIKQFAHEFLHGFGEKVAAA